MLFLFTTSKKKDGKSVLITSCVISYLLLSFVEVLRLKYFKSLPDTAIVNSVLSSAIGIVFTAIMSIIYSHKYFRKITVKLFHKTPNEDIWRDVLDLDKGSNLKVFLKDKDYYLLGHYKNLEEKGNDSWIALSAFSKRDVETNKNYKNEPDYNDKEEIVIVVKFSDVEHIEIF